MDTVREGIRAGDIERGRFDRLICLACNMELSMQDDPEVVGTIMACPSCETRWRDL